MPSASLRSGPAPRSQAWTLRGRPCATIIAILPDPAHQTLAGVPGSARHLLAVQACPQQRQQAKKENAGKQNRGKQAWKEKAGFVQLPGPPHALRPRAGRGELAVAPTAQVDYLFRTSLKRIIITPFAKPPQSFCLSVLARQAQ